MFIFDLLGLDFETFWILDLSTFLTRKNHWLLTGLASLDLIITRYLSAFQSVLSLLNPSLT